MQQYFPLWFRKCLILFFFTLSFLTSCNRKFYQNEGVVYYYSSLPKSELNENKIWFRDSTIVVEMRAALEESLNDTIVYRGYDVFKYTYVDLRTMRCQDYFTFTDTATPYYNYRLKNRKEYLLWNFYSLHDQSTPTMDTLRDTTIENVSYKRLRTKNKFPMGYEFVFYMASNMKNSIFHINKILDAKNPNYKIIRMDLVDSMSRTESTYKFNIVRERLLKSEKRVFKAWRKNARETKLPEVSFIETFNFPMPTKVLKMQ